MSQQDLDSKDTPYCFGLQLREAIEWLVPPKAFAGIQFRRDCSWTPWSLTAAALLWAWAGDPTLGGRFDSVRQIIQNVFGLQQEVAGSYQVFLKVLVRWTATLKGRFPEALQRRMKRRHGCGRVAGCTIFGVDGSRIELPRTKSNQAGYLPLSAVGKRKRHRPKARRGRSGKAQRKKAENQQIRITTMWHCGTGLPWDWRTGRADSSERAHLLEMIPALLRDALVTADAGFVGYEYWKALLDAGHPFVIRVGSNVKLLKKPGYARERNGLVYLRPDAVAANRLMQYVAEHREMVRYPEFRAKSRQIGSGPAEAECKTITQRVKGRVRRWNTDNSEAMTALHDGRLWHQRWTNLDPQRN